MGHQEDEDELEWEEWRPNEISFHHHMLAGSIAGLAEHITLFPVDTIKTNLQCQKCGSTSPFNCAARMVRNEGVFRLWRGVTATFSGCIPAHAAYFSVYESMKIFLKADNKDEHQPFRAALCGATAAISHDIFMNPFDVIKQRMQLGYYKSTFHCLREIIRSEGIRALYLSFPTTLLTNIPHGCVVVAANESARKILNPSGQYNLTSSLAAGCIAGGVAAAVTTPLDVIKTRLQTQDLVPCMELQSSNPNPTCALNNSNPVINSVSRSFPSSPSSSLHAMNSRTSSAMRYHTVTAGDLPFTAGGQSSSGSLGRVIGENFASAAAVARRILQEEGYRGFWRGAVPRVVAQAPSVAISWTVYEAAKSTLQWNQSKRL